MNDEEESRPIDVTAWHSSAYIGADAVISVIIITILVVPYWIQYYVHDSSSRTTHDANRHDHHRPTKTSPARKAFG
jgi:hypothetical protein